MQRGDVVRLGRHRLMCGDATNRQDILKLMGLDVVSMVFTSPPYPNRRIYGDGSNTRDDWDCLVADALDIKGYVYRHDAQILVNLGICHVDGEWLPYWHTWLNAMRKVGWRRFGLYVWDQGFGIPGSWMGRLAPSYELVFHLNKVARQPNNIVPCKHQGNIQQATGQTHADGKERGRWRGQGLPVATHRKSDSVIRIMRQTHRNDGTNHSAQFPPALAAWMMRSYSNPDECVYDPFGGVGSSIIAAEQTGRISLSMEIEPSYCEMAIARYRKMVAA